MLLGYVADFVVRKQQNPRKQALQALTDAASSGYSIDLALIKKGLRRNTIMTTTSCLSIDLALIKKGLRLVSGNFSRRPA